MPARMAHDRLLCTLLKGGFTCFRPGMRLVPVGARRWWRWYRRPMIGFDSTPLSSTMNAATAAAVDDCTAGLFGTVRYTECSELNDGA